MRARSSLSEVQREQLVELFEQGMGCRAAARVVGVSRDATRRLYRRFQLRGRLCLVEKPNKQHYSFEAKKEVVERHLAGESMMDLAREFNLSSDHLVKDWVAKWRRGGDEALRPKPKGRPKGSAGPKRLTEEEKLRRQVGECPILCVRGLGLQVVREAVHQPVSSTKYFAAPRNLTFTFSSMGTRSASESACAGP